MLKIYYTWLKFQDTVLKIQFRQMNFQIASIGAFKWHCARKDYEFSREKS